MIHKLLAAVLAAAMLSTASCGAVETLIGSGGAGTVGNLWPDVPPLDGATKADLQLPPTARLLIQALMQGRLDFIAYTTDKSPQDVEAFYTRERMWSAGWTADTTGCTTTASTGAVDATFCSFGKRENGKDIGLVIFVNREDAQKPTQVFYVRVDVTATPAP